MSFPFKNRISFGRRRTSREGLSIVEVLTSIVVAMIGVFGVMVLIPFAVKQAQTGLDSDAAVTAARNAYSQFEITGMRYPGNWADAGATYSPFAASSADPPRIFSIDPLAITENGSNFAAARFPFQHRNVVGTFPTSGTENLAIKALTLVSLPDPDGSGPLLHTNYSLEEARRMCRTANDLVFGEQASDFGGPVQYYDLDATASGPQRRQAKGRISWSAIVVPFKNESGGTAGVFTPRWSYRMYILVYKDRNPLVPLVAGTEGSMAVAILDTAGNRGVKSPLGNVFISTGGANPIVLNGALKRDDWVLLINRARNVTDEETIRPAGVTYAEKGFDKQLAFCRVVNFANEGTGLASVTLDGPDFNFGNPSDTSPSSVIRETYMIHLKDVVGVYERTFEPELQSNWNLSN